MREGYGVMTLVVALTLVGCSARAPDEQVPPSHSVGSAADAEPDVEPDVELREDLLRRAALDQAVRGGPPPDGMTADEVPRIDEVDASNQARIAEVLDEHGWPGWSLVGRRGSTAAWTIVQHADLDPELQRRGLELLQAAVEAGDASEGDLAYLTDRVRVADGEPQLYGTQWSLTRSGRWIPRTPIEDRADVDERRESAGLDPLAEYVAELRSTAP
ncbi:DUF6624 domain-containing protein [uncultured Nocardioides sp.]|uniref:DUF6624 domain-containing protein n=1 Tax=uncultured Nocardioides sp. TaxID=198441 RepID=UPI00261659C0|nr:DUF6624 domain-containing protein [uncultured Nocardioides sp.]